MTITNERLADTWPVRYSAYVDPGNFTPRIRPDEHGALCLFSGAESLIAALRDELATARLELTAYKNRAANWQNAAEVKQAKIDALMMEFCPGEMSAEQKDEWARNQQPQPSAGGG